MVEKIKLRKENLTKNGNELKQFVKACDGKDYPYNLESRGVYYCPGNLIIDANQDKMIKLPPHQVLAEYFIIDTKENKITVYDREMRDSFLKTVTDIEMIKTKDNLIQIIKKDDNIRNPKNKSIFIKLDQGKIISFEDNYTTKCGDLFLAWCRYLKELKMSRLSESGSFFVGYNQTLEKLSLPEFQECGIRFLYSNNAIKELVLPKFKKCGFQFMDSNNCLLKFYAPEFEESGPYFMSANRSLQEFYAPKFKKAGYNFLQDNNGKIKDELAKRIILTTYHNDLNSNAQSGEREGQWWN